MKDDYVLLPPLDEKPQLARNAVLLCKYIMYGIVAMALPLLALASSVATIFFPGYFKIVVLRYGADWMYYTYRGYGWSEVRLQDGMFFVGVMLFGAMCVVSSFLWRCAVRFIRNVEVRS